MLMFGDEGDGNLGGMQGIGIMNALKTGNGKYINFRVVSPLVAVNQPTHLGANLI